MITVTAADLMRAINLLAPLTPRISTVPIMTHMLVTVSEGEMALTASDLSIWVTCRIKATGDGIFLLPGEQFSALVRKLPSGADVSFEVKPTTINVTSGRARPRFAWADPSDYPVAAAPAGEAVLIDPASWCWALGPTSRSVAEDKTQWYLAGVHMTATAREGRNVLLMVATDGKRLCEARIPLLGTAAWPSITIPTETVGHILRALDGADAATITITEGQMRLDVPGGMPVTMTSKLIDSQSYPAFERIIPGPSTNILRIETAEMREALGRASIFARDKYQTVRLGRRASDIDDGELVADDFAETVAIEIIGEPPTIGLRAPHFIEALNALGAETVDLHIIDQKSPILLIAGNTDTVAMRYVLMPVT